MLGINRDHVPSAADDVIRDENRRVRAEAWSAFYRVKLLCDDPGLEKLAKAALDVTREMKRSKERATLDAAGDEVRRRIGLFLDAAATQTVKAGT